MHYFLYSLSTVFCLCDFFKCGNLVGAKIACCGSHTTSYDTMASIDIPSDYEPSDDDGDPGVASRLRRRKGGEVYNVSVANSARKVPRTKSLSVARRSLLPSTRRLLSTHLQHLKKQLKGSKFDTDLSLRVVHMSLKLQDGHLSSCSKKGDPNRGGGIRDKVCSFLGISPPTYYSIISNYFDEN